MSLIEVMVSILILSFGVLGLVAMQARASAISVDAENRNIAAMFANDMVATMQATNTSAPSSAVVTAWNNRIQAAGKNGLPNASGTVSAADANGVVTVTVSWQAPSATVASNYVTKVAF